MKKLLPLLKNVFAKCYVFFSIALMLIALLGINNKSVAQVYYMTNDATPGSASAVDGINRMDYNGANATLLANSFTVSPGLMEIDLPNNRAFVYEAFSSSPPTGLGIKVINLTTGAVTATIPITESTARCYSIKYDPINDYIYYVVADSSPTTTSSNDALIKVKPDGSGKTVVISGFSKNPTLLALDIAHNKAYVYNQLAVEKNFLTINLSGTPSVSQTITIVAPAGNPFLVNDIDYDAETDYLYYLSSNNSGSTNLNDAISKIHPNGTGYAAVVAVAQSPTFMALDLGNNRAFVFDNVAPARNISSIDLTSGTATVVKSLSGLPTGATVTSLWVPNVPVLSTATASSVAATTAVLGGNITRTDVAVSERGIVYSITNTLPTIGASGVTKVTNGTGIGSFTATVSGFTANNTYYARAYATSGAGTAYGGVTSFTTVKASQSITFATLESKTYGTANFAPGATASSGLAVSYTSSNSAVATIVSGNIHIVGVGTTTITASQAGDANTNAATDATQTLTVGKATVTVTAAAKTKVYGNADPAFTYTATGVVGSDAPTGALSRVTPSTNRFVGDYAINQGDLSYGSNYNITYVSTNLTITKRPLTIAPLPVTKQYGDADFATGAPYNFNGTSIAPEDAISGPFDKTPSSENAGTYALTIGLKHPLDPSSGQDRSANYDISFVTNTFTITPKTINVSANILSKAYGDADPVLTYSSSPLAFSDSFTGTLTRATGEGVGAYTITQGALALSSNYVLNFSVGNKLTIDKKTVFVNAIAKTKTYGAADPTFNYTADALAFTDTFSGSLSRPAGETIGTYAINQGSLALNSNYTLYYTGANLTIGIKAINVNAVAASKTFGETDPVLTYNADALVSGDAFTGSITRTAGETAGSYPITQGSLALSSNYTLNYTGANLTIGKRDITVNAFAQNVPYGDADVAMGYNTTGNAIVAGDAISGVLGRAPGTAIGTYAITQNTLTVSNSNNYNIIFNSAAYNIVPRPITVSSPFTVKFYGDADPALTYSVTSGSLLSGDVLSGALIRDAGETPGAYTVHRGTVAVNSTNYAINYQLGNFEIDRAPLTVTVNNSTKLAGHPNPTFTYVITGLKNAETEATFPQPFQTGTLATTSSPVGTYPVSAYNPSIANYDVTYVQGTLTVRAASANADLASLSAAEGTITPTFDAATTNYSLSVGADVSHVNVTGVLADANAKLFRISGLNATSGQANTVYVYPGDNQISVMVTAEDNSTSKEYIINISKPLDTNAKLSGLQLSYNDNSVSVPNFDPEVHAYTVNLPNEITSALLIPLAAGRSAYIKINGAPYEGYYDTGVLTPGDNNFSFEVIAQDRTVSEIYTLNVKRALSTNNKLSNVTLSTGSLSPVFSTDVLNYTANVASNIVSIDVQGFVADTTARYKVNGSVLADRYQPYTVALTGGQNTITLQVTAKNGDVREYRVVINKALSTNATLANLTVNSVQLIPIFAPNVTDYNQTIPFSRTSVNITPTAETAGTTISINGTPVVSGNNINIPIVVGTNTISVVSTAEDGSTTKTYTLNINRTGSGNALLTRIILDPVSTLSATTGSANENYQTSVSPAISSVRLKATAQQADGVIRINGTVVTNDNYSNPITLEVGITVINVVITAQDGITTKSYSITVNRAGSSNASITGLALDPISKLSAITGSASENYQASVSPAISSVRLKATAQQADAVIRVNGTLVTNDNYSNPILLQAGTTVINVVITAQDGITNKSYSITVNRAGSNNAAATGFALDPVSKLSAITGSASENYQASVSPAISSVRLKATTQQADAVIRVNGTVITNDNYSNPILLQAGATVIN
ncbi:MBG domain-containing protein, partial [Mucilaginibacter sp. 5C4]